MFGKPCRVSSVVKEVTVDISKLPGSLFNQGPGQGRIRFDRPRISRWPARRILVSDFLVASDPTLSQFDLTVFNKEPHLGVAGNLEKRERWQNSDQHNE